MTDPIQVPQKNRRVSAQPIYEFQGRRYYIRASGLGYYSSRKTNQALHRDVWSSAYGAIPEGHDIHHCNGDRTDNRLANLECIPRGAHQREHNLRPERRKWFKAVVAAARRERVEKRCDSCGEPYAVDPFNAGKSRFCKARCLQRARRARVSVSGADDVRRACSVCGAGFTTNRHQPRKTCSKSCMGLAISEAKRELGPYMDLEVG